MAENRKRVILPPIERPTALDDAYKKSKLMTYTRSRERQQMLNKIMLVALKICKVYFIVV